MYAVREYGCCEVSRDRVAALLDEYKHGYFRARGIAGLADGVYYLLGWKGWINGFDGPACTIDAIFLPADGDGEFDLRDLESRIRLVSLGEDNIMAGQIFQCELAKRANLENEVLRRIPGIPEDMI
jgi:hypothetical protein